MYFRLYSLRQVLFTLHVSPSCGAEQSELNSGLQLARALAFTDTRGAGGHLKALFIAVPHHFLLASTRN